MNDDTGGKSALSEGLGALLVIRVMSAVWSLVRSGPNYDGRHHDVEAAILAALDAAVAAERERLLSMPNLMHACDHLGVPSDGTHCDILRRALYRA